MHVIKLSKTYQVARLIVYYTNGPGFLDFGFAPLRDVILRPCTRETSKKPLSGPGGFMGYGDLC